MRRSTSLRAALLILQALYRVSPPVHAAEHSPDVGVADDIGARHHAVTGLIGVSPLYIEQPARNSNATSFAEFAAQYTYRLRYFAFGIAMSIQNASAAGYPVAELMLPISRVELALTFGYGPAYAWQREFVNGVGFHVVASSRLLIHIDSDFDLGVAVAVVGEQHPGLADEVPSKWVGTPIRLVGRLRF